MRLWKVAFPLYQQAGHQNHTTEAFHAHEFSISLPGCHAMQYWPDSQDTQKNDVPHYLCCQSTWVCETWFTEVRRGGEGIRPEISSKSCLVRAQLLLLFHTHWFLAAYIRVHLNSIVTGYNYNHLSTPGRYFSRQLFSWLLLWARGDLVPLLTVGVLVPPSACWWIRLLGHVRETKEKAQHHLKAHGSAQLFLVNFEHYILDLRC